MAIFYYESIIKAPVTDVFAFYNDINNLSLITPDFAKVEIVHVDGDMTAGTRIELLVKKPFKSKWVVLIQDHQPNRYFIDIQEEGLFVFWRHRHEFKRCQQGTRLVDSIEYQLPLYPLSWPVQNWIVEKQLKKMFLYRHSKTQQLLEK